MANESEGETGNTQGRSSAGSEAVGGNEIVQEGECGRGEGEGEAVVGQGNLIGKKDIRRVSDKKVVEVHGGQAPSEGSPEGDGCWGTDCMRVGRGGHAGMKEGVDKADARRGMGLGRYSR